MAILIVQWLYAKYTMGQLTFITSFSLSNDLMDQMGTNATLYRSTERLGIVKHLTQGHAPGKRWIPVSLGWLHGLCGCPLLVWWPAWVFLSSWCLQPLTLCSGNIQLVTGLIFFGGVSILFLLTTLTRKEVLSHGPHMWHLAKMATLLNWAKLDLTIPFWKNLHI